MADTFRRLSIAFKRGKVNKSLPKEPGTRLAQFLSTTKLEYLQAIKDTPSRGGHWTVVMGNESGDLDSITSAIAYAWVESEVHKRPTVPLIPMERDDIDLRAENIYALKQAGILKPKEQLLFLTDIPQLQDSDTPFPSYRFVLVDHNKIKSRYMHNNPEARVVAVVDHRPDENEHKETANPRIVLPCGSCCSHITSSILPTPSDPLPSSVPGIPTELATLLLCGIMIDTDGLKPGGKALQLDRDAAATLVPLSNYAPTITPSLRSALVDGAGAKPKGNPLYDEKSLKDLTATLSTKKTEISHLGTRDLLRRDYKEYDYHVEWLAGRPKVKVGLSTIPLALKDWAKEGTVEKEIMEWMKSRGLNVHGAITSFREKPGKKDKEDGKHSKGKARREQVWMVLDPAALNKETGTSDGTGIDVKKLSERLWSCLEADENLKLKRHNQLALNKGKNVLPKGVRVKAYHQGDPGLTRKYTAPLLGTIMTEAASGGEGDTAGINGDVETKL